MILEIQGLRAVAALLVVLFHARFVSGGFIGVDIFYVISGYLITGLLLREIDKTGAISFLKFFSRRVKRLLPSSFLVLIVTGLVSFGILPGVARYNVGRDVVAGALYISNYLFAYWQNDYQNLGATPSPIIHFWSLAVEEQFYLLWPFLLWIAFKRGGRRWLFRAIAAITFLSFFFSLYLTSHSPIWSFYSLPTRAWELGVGALILWRPPIKPIPKLFGLFCLFAIVFATFGFDSGTPFPGWAALAPVLGCAGLIRYVSSLSKVISRPLRHPIAQWIGAISYPAYLWHWPVLILAPQWLGHSLTVAERIIGILVTLLFADMTHRFVERPFRSLNAKPRYVFLAAAVLTAGSVSLGATIAFSAPTTIGSSISLAEVMRKPAIYADGCQLDKNQTSSGPCIYGDSNSRKTVVLFGDSHAAQWFPTFDSISKAQKWRLVVLTKSSCPSASVTLPDNGAFRNSPCEMWRENSFLQIEKLKPFAVFTSNFAHYAPPPAITNAKLWWQNGYAITMKRLGHLISTPVNAIAIDDTPLPTQDIPSCLTSKDAAFCGAIASPPLLLSQGFSLIEPTEWFCQSGKCPAIRFGVVAYRDTTHISVDYALRLVSEMTKALKKLGLS